MRKRIVFFTKYSDAGPSSRYRSYQYFPYYRQAGFEVNCKPLLTTKYIQKLYATGRRPLINILPRYFLRFFQLIFLKNYSIIYIEQELFPFMPFFIEKWLLINKKNIIFDFDDAIFHNYDKSKKAFVKKVFGNKIYKLVAIADIVITGSPYLTEVLEQYCKKVIEIPTSIDFKKYDVAKTLLQKNNKFSRIGWIGSKTTSVNIKIVTEAIKKIQQKNDSLLVLIGFDESLLADLTDIKYEIIKWDASTEVAAISSFDAGIMPLEENDFNNGKCGFKLIQYMACSVSTISTPLQANIKIDRNKKNLFASNESEWEFCIQKIIDNKTYFKDEVGPENREIVKLFYSIEANHKKYLSIFDEFYKKD